MFIEGKSQSTIASTLTKEGVPTPSGKTKWQYNVVDSILRNEKYKGSALLQKKYTVDFLTKKLKKNNGEVAQYYVEDSHPAIINPDEWELVQAELELNNQVRSHGNNVRDDNDEFWRELSKIDNVFVSRYNCYYEDDNVIIYMLEASYDYYYRDYKNEAKDILLNKIKEDKKLFDNMNNDKVKIVICHSPIYMTDSDILNEFKDFNFIFCGHMHNGMIPYLCDKIIRNNRGIVSPYGKLFSNNTRGTIDINNIHLIINGGITKLSKSSGIFSYFNFIYPISLDNIVINRKM